VVVKRHWHNEGMSNKVRHLLFNRKGGESPPFQPTRSVVLSEAKDLRLTPKET